MATVYAEAYYGAIPDLERPGVPMCRSAQYINSGDKADGTIVAALNLPAGAKLLSIDWKSSALGAGRTIDIGTSAEPNKYVAGAAVSSATTGSAVCINEDITSKTSIQIQVSGGTFPDGGQLDINVWYKMAAAIDDEA